MKILAVADEPKTRRAIAAAAGRDFEIASVSNGPEALRQIEQDVFDAVCFDLDGCDRDGLEWVQKLLNADPGLPIVAVAASATVNLAVEAMRCGAFDFLPKPFAAEQLRESLQKAARCRGRGSATPAVHEPHDSSLPELGFRSADPEMNKTLEVAFRAAAAPTTILMLGESGTGKSVLARAIHERSQQRDSAFVTVNCPCLTRELLESELFGHKKGSFTGAVSDTWGKVAAAEGGTIFLDEVGELPLEIQPKLLRLLQDREYERIGETKARKANVRVIAATNSNLKDSVNSGGFREDLYYRLNVITLTVPPLRERTVDLPMYADYFLRAVSAQIGKKFKGFTDQALNIFRSYHWPGNLRELRNVIERTAILCDKDEIDAGDLPDILQAPKPGLPLVGAQISLQKLEEEHIRHVIARSSSFEHAARILGIDPTTLYRKRKKMEQEEKALAGENDEAPG